MATATIIDQTDPPLLKRARRYEREALQDLFDRNVDRVYAISSALTGDPAGAERHTRTVFKHVLERLDNFAGNAREFEAWVCRLAATENAPGPPTDVLRRAYRSLDATSREILSLRVMTGLETGRVSHVVHLSDHEMLSALVRALRAIAGVPGRGPSVADLTPFDNALSRVQRGDTPEGAAAGVTVPPDAHLLLATAAHCMMLADQSLEVPARRRLRAAFLADAGERRARWVEEHRKPPGVAGVTVKRGGGRFTSGAILVFFIVVAIVVGVLVAVVSMFSDPDSPFYSTKLTAENMLLAVQFSPTNKANLQLELASTRESEAEDMAIDGKGSLAVQAMRRRFTLLQDAAGELARDPNHNTAWIRARSQWEQESSLSTLSIQKELVAAKQPGSAAQVKSMTATFDQQRKTYIAELTAKPATGTSPTPAATPTG
ncbi:MAG: DUF5667 domain-containing protein [Candidatus Dormibacteraceae bacterium]